jgi:hypothetical protein
MQHKSQALVALLEWHNSASTYISKPLQKSLNSGRENHSTYLLFVLIKFLLEDITEDAQAVQQALRLGRMIIRNECDIIRIRDVRCT